MPAAPAPPAREDSDASHAVQLFRNGIDGLGYLLKSSVGEVDELVHALQEVAVGRSVVDAGVVERLVQFRTRQAESPVRDLAPREPQVLREMAEGRPTGRSPRACASPSRPSSSTSTRSSRS
jgi:DNA-binding NarL/FixJ family response regulator